jgi:hypothetical protein
VYARLFSVALHGLRCIQHVWRLRRNILTHNVCPVRKLLFFFCFAEWLNGCTGPMPSQCNNSLCRNSILPDSSYVGLCAGTPYIALAQSGFFLNPVSTQKQCLACPASCGKEATVHCVSPTAPTSWQLVDSRTGLPPPLRHVCSVTARVLAATALDHPTVRSVSMQATRATARRLVWSAPTLTQRQRHAAHVMVRVAVLDVAARLPLSAHPVQLRDLEPTARSPVHPTMCCSPVSVSLVIPTV